MAEASSNCGTERAPRSKRRNVRKGTLSCWECKRRKVRCTFVAPTEAVCDGCRSRRLKCISQEFYNETGSASSKSNRLDRVEALVEQLTKRVDPEFLNMSPDDRQDVGTNTMRSLGSDIPLTLAPSAIPTPGTRIAPGLNIQTKSGLDELCGTLLAAWPNPSELDLILSVPVGTSVLFHGTICMPYSSFLSKDMPSPQEILQLPPLGSHPTFIARKLLMLGSILQGAPLAAIKDLERLGPRPREIMSRVVETARTLVTCKDDLVDSLEGVECIMIESMYQNNAGNLRQAWLSNRRAMSMAQMMGIHRDNTPPLNLLDFKTRERIDPEYMWLRLVSSDRYLSLMLGLPQGSQDSHFATPDALKRCAAVERMERIEAMVGGLIIQRNMNDLHNLEATHKIDKLLQDAAATMPAQWWLVPDVAAIAGSDRPAFRETLRIINQFTHYHLLAQLHLPYLLQSSADQNFDYSKITAVNASREILSRFVRFPGSSAVAAYCRGIDFLAFIASTTLCLAHIDARRQYVSHMGNGAPVFHSLVHQQLGDRGLMECTLQSMEEMAQAGTDPIACKIASILRRLLSIEAAVADGGCYTTSLCSGSGAQEIGCGGDGDDSRGTLRIDIPHLGAITIERGGVVRYPEVAQKPSEESVGPCSASKTSYSDPRLCFEPVSPLNRIGERSGWGAMPPVKPPSAHVGGQAAPSDLDFIRPPEESQPVTIEKEFFSLDDNPPGMGRPLSPGIAADADDWALQGVDLALFDSLFEGQGTQL